MEQNTQLRPVLSTVHVLSSFWLEKVINLGLVSLKSYLIFQNEVRFQLNYFNTHPVGIVAFSKIIYVDPINGLNTNSGS